MNCTKSEYGDFSFEELDDDRTNPDRINLEGVYPYNEVSEVTLTDEELEYYESLAEKSVSEGLCVGLGERAFYLLEAMGYYSKASQKRGFAKAYPKGDDLQKDYTAKEAHRIIASESSYRKKGDHEFFKAVGVEALLAAGYDPEIVKIEAQLSANQFVNTYSGSKNEDKREAFCLLLNNQIK